MLLPVSEPEIGPGTSSRLESRPTTISGMTSQLLSMAHLFGEPSTYSYAEEVMKLMAKAMTIAKMIQERPSQPLVSHVTRNASQQKIVPQARFFKTMKKR